jgi:hypothetical protein
MSTDKPWMEQHFQVDDQVEVEAYLFGVRLDMGPGKIIGTTKNDLGRINYRVRHDRKGSTQVYLLEQLTLNRKCQELEGATR